MQVKPAQEGAAWTVPDYARFGGRHCQTGSLKNVLAHLGVLNPFTGQAFTEELLLGIGGGIGVSYFQFDFGGKPAAFIGGRYPAKPSGADFIEQICARLGLLTTLYETAGTTKGEQALIDTLRRLIPAIVWGDMPYLPYLALPENAHFGGHTFVVYGLDLDRQLVQIADRGAGPLTAAVDELRAARASKHKPFPPGHKLLAVETAPHTVPAGTLQRAVLRGISDCCRAMRNPPIRNLGLQGLLKWAGLVANAEKPQGWPNAFPPGMPAYGTLMSAYIFIEISGTGGSSFRSMYAAFLHEACAILGIPRLAEAACMYDEGARRWSNLATAMLPDAVPLLGRTRRLLAAKNELFEREGAAALPRMLAINREFDAILTEVRSQFPLQPAELLDLYAGLREKILAVHEAESEAVAVLEAAIR
jgi:hypothetical protein